MTAPDAYADLDLFRQYLRAAAVLDEADDADSDIEAIALEAAARAIDRACGRDFRVAADSPSARTFTASVEVPPYWASTARPHLTLAIDDLFDTVPTVAFDVARDFSYTYPVTGFILAPSTAPARGLPYTLLRFAPGVYPPSHEDGVEVTAVWGWTATPAAIVNANLMQAARFMKRRDAPFGIAGSPEMGSEMRLLSKLDPDVALLIGGYKRNWGAVGGIAVRPTEYLW
jgi:hypothetical protein